MKKLIAILSILILNSCGYFNQLDPDKDLPQIVETELKENQEIDFEKVTDFLWDSMIFMSPYSNIKRVKDSLDLDLRNIRGNGIQNTDFYSLVIFLKDKKSVKIIELNRQFSYQNNELIPVQNSYFKMDENGILTRVDQN